MSECEYLKKAGCCAHKFVCEGQVPTRRVTNLFMCRDPVENDCAVYKRALMNE